MLPTPVFLGFPDDSAGRESACNAGDLNSIPGLGRSPGEGNGHPFHSCSKNDILGGEVFDIMNIIYDWASL